MNRRAALWLGAANAAEYATQLLLPALLVRTLSPVEFGGYRLLWLVAQTSATALSLNMALNLLYLAPRHARSDAGRLFGNALAYLAAAAVLAALLASAIAGQVITAADGVVLPFWFIPAFAALWMVSLPFDSVALVAGRPHTQALLFGSQTLLRVTLLGAAAWFMRDLQAVAFAMLGLAAFRLVVGVGYARGSGAFPNIGLSATLARQQLRYGFAFGLGASLYVLRGQVDIWIAAALFDPVAVATLSIAMVIGPVIGAVRQAFTQATVSDVARLVSQGEFERALKLNNTANSATALIVFPLIGAFVVAAPDAIRWVYTDAFVGAALPARLYAVTLAACALELSPFVQALGNGRFVVRSGALLLVLGAAASGLGGSLWGLPGIAAGAALALWAGTALNLRHVALHCQRPIASLQPWRDIGLLFALAAMASVLGMALLSQVVIGMPAWRAVLAGGLFAACYAVLVGVVPTARRMHLRHWRRPAPGGDSHA